MRFELGVVEVLDGVQHIVLVKKLYNADTFIVALSDHISKGYIAGLATMVFKILPAAASGNALQNYSKVSSFTWSTMVLVVRRLSLLIGGRAPWWW